MQYFYSLLLLHFLSTFSWFETSFVEGIIGGDYAPATRFSYQLSVQYNKVHICGGVIVSHQHAISAAHCFINYENDLFQNGPYSIIAGTRDLRNSENHRIMIEKVYIPKEFMFNNPNQSSELYNEIGDIAVIKVHGLFVFNEVFHMSKVDLPEEVNISNYIDKSAFVSGFGIHSYITKKNAIGQKFYEINLEMSNKLKYAEAKVISNDECKKMYIDPIYESHLCARVLQHLFTDFEGVCGGDSGSPLIVNENTLIGVVVSTQENCDERLSPTIYTRVTSYLSFIKKSMNDETSPDIRCATYDKAGFVRNSI